MYDVVRAETPEASAVSDAVCSALQAAEGPLSSLPIGIYACDKEGYLVQYNARAAELWGRSPTVGDRQFQFCGAYRAYRLTGEPLPPCDAPMAEVLQTGKPIRDRELIVERPDGSRITILANFDPLFDANGHIVGGVNCFQDISELKQVQRELEERQRLLAERESWYRGVLEALAAAVYTTDADGRITFYNEAAVELSGRRPQLGSDQWCVSWRLFNPDGTPLRHDECPMAVALKENRPVRGEDAIAERPDRSRVVFTPYPTPLHDKSGKLVGAVNLLMEATEQRKAEADAAYLAAIIASSDDAIISKTLEGRITSWNDGATRIFGYEAAEMLGEPITRIIPPDLHGEEAQILARLGRGERIEHFETVRVGKDGRRVDVSLTVSPVRNTAGKIIGASKIARDITERKCAEETEKLLIGELNHRVKNTLATVQSIASQTLRRAKTPTEFVSSFLGRIQALASAHTILTQSNWHGAELSALIRSQVFVDGTSDDRIAYSGPEIVLEPQLALHLALILHELGTNARKHGALSAPHGRVAVTWAVEETPVRGIDLRWSETGGPPVYLDYKPKAGFGTVLIERIMRSVEGGDAHMRFEADGISWTLRLPLPASSKFPRVSPASLGRAVRSSSAERREAGAYSKGKRILVIEDEPLVAMEMAAALGEAGFQVLGPVGVVHKALRLIARADFDAALLDANLAGTPVDELAAALTRRNIPFAFVTGYGRESLPKPFAAALVLTKPFDAKALVNTTRQILSQSTGALAMRRGKDP